jgi:hypothetical protein
MDRPKLKKRVKKLWLDALRSGKLRQATRALHRVDNSRHHAYCCLGVLCSIAEKEGVVEKVKNSELDLVEYDGEECTLPESVINWAFTPKTLEKHVRDDLCSPTTTQERTTEEASKDFNSNPHDLASMNDAGYKFKHIADVIERDF